MRYPARYYDGRTARQHVVMTEISREGITILEASDGSAHGETDLPGTRELQFWSARQIEFRNGPRGQKTARLGRTGSLERLVIDDENAIAALQELMAVVRPHRRASRKTIGRLIGWSAASVASLALLVFVVIPLTAQQLAAVTPHAFKLEVGQIGLEQATRLFGAGESGGAAYCTGSAGLKALERMTERLTRHAPGTPKVSTYVINSRIENAFALPGNLIGVTSGLLAAAPRDIEIAGILAHELGHVVHDHAMASLYRNTSFMLLMFAVFGDVGLSGTLPFLVLATSYSRDAEGEADEFALSLLKRANISPLGLADFFKRAVRSHGQSHQGLGFLSTHPASEDRLARILAAGSEGDTRLLAKAEWNDLKQVCGKTQETPP